MEADIRWRYHVSSRDLSWRDRAALIRHLPADSAIAAIGRDGPHWTLEAHLLDDVRILLLALLGAEKKDLQPHPQRPKAAKKPVDPVAVKKRAEARERAAERDRQIAAGEIT